MGLLIVATDWTPVWVALASSIPGGIAAVIAAYIANMNRRTLRTPSGDSIGQVMERTHDLSAVDVGMSTETLKHVRALNGQSGERVGDDPPDGSRTDDPG